MFLKKQVAGSLPKSLLIPFRGVGELGPVGWWHGPGDLDHALDLHHSCERAFGEREAMGSQKSATLALRKGSGLGTSCSRQVPLASPPLLCQVHLSTTCVDQVSQSLTCRPLYVVSALPGSLLPVTHSVPV